MTKKILIISRNFDRSTDIVLQWLNFYKVSFIRINHGDELKVVRIEIMEDNTELLLEHKGRRFFLSEITGFWYRKGRVRLSSLELNSEFLIEQGRAISAINKYLNDESSILEEYFYHKLESLPVSIGRRSTSRNNKLVHLELAREVGFKIPDTSIVTESKDALNFLKSKKSITKAISDSLTISVANTNNEYTSHSIYTNEVDEKIFKSVSANFFPSLIQKQIAKKIELRVFYLKGEIFPMAIFSQNDQQTQVDFRHYNFRRPNRMVPFKIDLKTCDKIRTFMSKANLDTGSLDLILSEDNEIYFLEVNPVGQFGMVSFPCNYNLEKKIAEILMN